MPRYPARRGRFSRIITQTRGGMIWDGVPVILVWRVGGLLLVETSNALAHVAY